MASFVHRTILVSLSCSVDATEEPTTGPMLGRLVNHGERQEVNVKLVVIDVGSLPVLCMFALRNIREDEELLYNYGTNNLPWKENLPVMTLFKKICFSVLKKEEMLSSFSMFNIRSLNIIPSVVCFFASSFLAHTMYVAVCAIAISHSTSCLG